MPKPPDSGATLISGMGRTADDLLDLRGLKCPQPVLRLRKRLRQLGAGATIRVECTDPLVVIDVPNALREMGHDLISVEQDGAVLTFCIRTRVGPGIA